MNNDITIKNSTELLDELWNTIKSSGLYAYSKNDIYDYLIYLINKYDENHFFDKNSNAENERLLKISSTKIKNTKKNISLKFMNDKEFDNVFLEYLDNLNADRLKDGSNGNIKLIIENPVIRDILENKLKMSVGNTFEYHINRETVDIKADDFAKMLEKELINLKKDKSEISKKIQNKIERICIRELLEDYKGSPKDMAIKLIQRLLKG
ncbi:hypothetical protein OFO01_01150 [Campylobacter sp. JMF_01 NE2]|uniref:hypothetical protein n=1 Tax=unclassified Campylobacter TaxID=2593542 RepID=UPI0022E9B468|nr:MULTISPECIES: hypothetical protein [unclassified Campylobacter]MDA3052060.1 hypothetical protein [Campylobacter sp. JMF_03 NE3]MDA3066394.1 hypothetical protein [Campylobacter sp. JMF_01 NE2]